MSALLEQQKTRTAARKHASASMTGAAALTYTGQVDAILGRLASDASTLGKRDLVLHWATHSFDTAAFTKCERPTARSDVCMMVHREC